MYHKQISHAMNIVDCNYKIIECNIKSLLKQHKMQNNMKKHIKDIKKEKN